MRTDVQAPAAGAFTADANRRRNVGVAHFGLYGILQVADLQQDGGNVLHASVGPPGTVQGDLSQAMRAIRDTRSRVGRQPGQPLRNTWSSWVVRIGVLGIVALRTIVRCLRRCAVWYLWRKDGPTACQEHHSRLRVRARRELVEMRFATIVRTVASCDNHLEEPA